MNERIKELSKQAWESISVQDALDDEAFDQFDQKFAELIVKECVQTLIDNMPERYTNEASEEDWDKGYDRAMKDCVHHIQEHFGVEE